MYNSFNFRLSVQNVVLKLSVQPTEKQSLFVRYAVRQEKFGKNLERGFLK